MSYLLITSRDKFIFEPMSVIDIETTVIEFLRSESKRFDTRYADEADGSINKYEIPLRFCLYMQSLVTSIVVWAMNSVIGPHIIGLSVLLRADLKCICLIALVCSIQDIVADSLSLHETPSTIRSILRLYLWLI